MSSLSLKLGYKYLRSNKGGIFSFTTILAIIGLMIGIASLIVVTSIMNGFEKELENRILGVIPHSVIYADAPINNYDQIIEEIKSDNNIIDASPYINIQGLISSSYESMGIKEKKSKSGKKHVDIGEMMRGKRGAGSFSDSPFGELLTVIGSQQQASKL